MSLLTHNTKLTQAQLESALWDAANALRGTMDAADFKTYVFPVLFYKWISDNWTYRHTEAQHDLGEDWDQDLENRDYQPFVVPAKAHWSAVATKTVGAGFALRTALQLIEQANPDLAGVFGD